jgi:CrcB protein
MTFVLVIAAGAAGVAARYGLTSLFHVSALPWATVGINLAGSFLLGVLVVLPSDWMTQQTRLAIGVGLLGGFTTFSTAMADSLRLMKTGKGGLALFHLFGTFAGAVIACQLGYAFFA